MNIHKKFEVFLYSLLSSVISMNVLWEADVYSEKNIYLGMLITIQSFIGTRVILEFIYRNIFSHKLWFHKEESMFQHHYCLEKIVMILWFFLVFIEIILVVEYPTKPKLFLFKSLTALMILLGSIELGSYIRQIVNHVYKYYTLHYHKRKP
ncbi:hypothetical protein NUITMVR1_43770 [Raoultella ornithinolytica]|nr:hypothetical protein NUITMVR1_43770 [Raoultella ornithinolytica]CAE6379060.1 hypothetical protein AI2711V1_4189 [Raoultella ornithinolytica]CAH3699577.1 hypothetical protein AI2711V1_4189 [Raoultella ornithinolytica]